MLDKIPSAEEMMTLVGQSLYDVWNKLCRTLWEYVLNHSERNVFTVNSSPYAVPVYRKLGFVETDTEQLADGMRYTPMKFVNACMQ